MQVLLIVELGGATDTIGGSRGACVVLWEWAVDLSVRWRGGNEEEELDAQWSNQRSSCHLQNQAQNGQTINCPAPL